MRSFFISPLILQKLIWIPTKISLYFFGRIEVRGMENLKGIGRNVIFACNHTSELDPILIPGTLPFWSRFSPIFYTSREETFYENSGWRRHFYGGTFFKAWGSYPVFAGLKNYEKSLMHHIEIIRAGGSLCIFPEGRITRDGNIQPAKGGVAYLSYITKVPIVPVRLNGAYRMSFADFLLRRRRLSVTYGVPMYVGEKLGTSPSIDDLKAYANEVMDEVKRLKPSEQIETVRHGVKAGAVV